KKISPGSSPATPPSRPGPRGYASVPPAGRRRARVTSVMAIAGKSPRAQGDPMQLARIEELDALARGALARRDSRALRTIIARFGDDISPRLLLVAIAAARALDDGDVLRAVQCWEPFAEACRAAP